MAASLEASKEIPIRADMGKCFSFFTDLVNIGACIPGCEQVFPLDPTNATFKVKVKVGYISKVFELKAKLKEVRPNEHVSFTGEGSDAEIIGNVDFESQDSVVNIKYSIKITPISVTGRTAMSMIGKGLVEKQASEFASCVRHKLES